MYNYHSHLAAEFKETVTILGTHRSLYLQIVENLKCCSCDSDIRLTCGNLADLRHSPWPLKNMSSPLVRDFVVLLRGFYGWFNLWNTCVFNEAICLCNYLNSLFVKHVINTLINVSLVAHFHRRFNCFESGLFLIYKSHFRTPWAAVRKCVIS